MASAALLFSFSAILFLFLLLQAPAPAPGLAVADLLASALDRFLDGRGLLELLATRRNMILLCHAILLVILRDAGVLGTPARRRSRSPPAVATAVAVVAQTAAPARPHATRSAVVWRRRPRNRAAAATVHDGVRHLAEHQTPRGPAAEAVATWAAPVLTGPPQASEDAAAVATKQIVIVELPRNDDDDLLDHHDHGRDAVVEPLEHPTPTAIAADNETDDCDDRRFVAVAVADDDDKRIDDTAREQQTAGMEMDMELADDRTFEEFIKSQRRQMRQESLRLVRVSSGYHYQAIASCY